MNLDDNLFSNDFDYRVNYTNEEDYILHNQFNGFLNEPGQSIENVQNRNRIKLKVETSYNYIKAYRLILMRCAENFFNKS